jgi:hypothetical protein
MTDTLFAVDRTGSTPAQRADEAGHILKMIAGREHTMSEREEAFVSQTRQRLDKFGLKTIISPKQLFWLRDIKDRYL